MAELREDEMIRLIDLYQVSGQSRLCQSDTIQVDGTPCSEDKEACEFRLEIKHKLTMTLDRNNRLFAHNYKLYNHTDREATTPLDESQYKDMVVVADGWTPARLVTVVNDTMPGPCLVLYEGQKVTVHVFNDLWSDGLTIHWHGLHMTDNAYNDGVSFVTQCPILPRETFTYTFTAETKGTYWYHAHIGTVRTMGVLGPLIVRERNSQSQLEERVLVLQDWNHDVTSDQMRLGFFSGSGADQQMQEIMRSLDGGKFDHFAFQSGLINGRGRTYAGSMTVQTETPLEVIEVDSNQQYRFRVINAGSLYPFRVAVEGHRLSVVAADGWDLQPVVAESFIINPAERYDFVLTTNQTVNNYLIYAETLEVNISNPNRHVAEAILRYAGAPASAQPPDLPVDRGCTADDKCVVVNCPFRYYPQDQHTECVLLNQLTTGPGGAPAPAVDNPTDLIEIFLNFAFPGPVKTEEEASVNGIQFLQPPVAAILRAKENKTLPTACRPACGRTQEQCACSHVVTLTRDRVHQFVLLGMGNGKDNPDIDCRGPADRTVTLCNTATWKNETWRAENGGVVPGLNLDNPIRKDTIIVPTGGYVVVRIKADNPGMWYMHCHMEIHHLGGMALILDGTSPTLGPVPDGFPTCNSYPPE
nr:hypothetical protein BaRGS_006283 [Batillaria attramentaria]